MLLLGLPPADNTGLVARLVARDATTLQSSRITPQAACLCSTRLVFRDKDRLPNFVILAPSDFGLLGRVLYGFLW